jgi:hypothetical protein
MLDARLARLATLGLRRPANVLLAEYLAALAAERILDDDAAAEVAAAYNRLRYAPAAGDDPQLAAAVAALDAVALRLAALSAPERADVARRVRARLPAQSADEAATGLDLPTGDALERDTECLADAGTPVPPTRSQPASSPGGAAAATHARSAVGARAADSSDPVDGLAQPARPRAGRQRISLELAALVALATFFGGYFSREMGKQTLDAAGDVDASIGSTGPVFARDAWKDAGLWSYCLRERAAEDARLREYGKARLALELALASTPNEAGVLNDLAALYLIPDEADRTDPKRARELADRGLASVRWATILDTAAEAHFRCGDVSDAIRLEQESLTRGGQLDGQMTADFREHCRRQLARYQSAARAESGSQAASPPKTGPSRS